MSRFYATTVKYFHLAVVEFLPKLYELRDKVHDEQTKKEIEDLIEFYEDVDAKIESYHLNYDDPNRFYKGESVNIEISLSQPMIENLARLSRRLLLAWKERLSKLRSKLHLTEKNEEEQYRLVNLIWPLEAQLKEPQTILGQHRHLDPLVFPGETSHKTDERNPDNQASLEAYFSAGRPFEAIQVLGSILRSAKARVWIEDNFCSPDMVSIVEPYIATESITEVRFLTREDGNSNFKSFCVYLERLREQYPQATLEAKENDHCHDRYIIIDGKDIYHSGHSFHALGKKASQISEMTDDMNRKRIIADFENWWNTGNTI